MRRETDTDKERRELARDVSPLLRFYDITARRTEGDFEFDLTRLKIILSPETIDEAKTQEQKHSRYNDQTIFILAAIWPTISKLNADDPMREEYEELEGLLGTCDVVTLEVVAEEAGAWLAFTITTLTSMQKEKSINPQGSKIEGNPLKERIQCNSELYEVALEQARENGFRRINCAARTVWRRALKLAYSCEFIKPDQKVQVMENKTRAEDILKVR